MVKRSDLSPGDAVVFTSMKPEKYGPLRLGYVAREQARPKRVLLEWHAQLPGDSGWAHIDPDRIVAVVPKPPTPAH